MNESPNAAREQTLSRDTRPEGECCRDCSVEVTCYSGRGPSTRRARVRLASTAPEQKTFRPPSSARCSRSSTTCRATRSATGRRLFRARTTDRSAGRTVVRHPPARPPRKRLQVVRQEAQRQSRRVVRGDSRQTASQEGRGECRPGLERLTGEANRGAAETRLEPLPDRQHRRQFGTERASQAAASSSGPGVGNATAGTQSGRSNQLGLSSGKCSRMAGPSVRSNKRSA